MDREFRGQNMPVFADRFVKIQPDLSARGHVAFSGSEIESHFIAELLCS
jgi:hypothetical protein